jgi:organic hydroperoxide reductase OsmC/OhrA
MAEYVATVRWERHGEKFTDNRYSRAHQWEFDGGVTVPASSSPHVVKLPLSKADAVDPEEAFVASLSSCHMLFFLSLAAREGFVIDSYVDQAIGYLEKDDRGRLVMSRVVLRPKIAYAGASPSPEQLASLHDRSHHECFIANSVKTKVTVE